MRPALLSRFIGRAFVRAHVCVYVCACVCMCVRVCLSECVPLSLVIAALLTRQFRACACVCLPSTLCPSLRSEISDFANSKKKWVRDGRMDGQTLLLTDARTHLKRQTTILHYIDFCFSETQGTRQFCSLKAVILKSNENKEEITVKGQKIHFFISGISL